MYQVKGQKKKKQHKRQCEHRCPPSRVHDIPLIRMNTGVIITANMNVKPSSLHLECQVLKI